MKNEFSKVLIPICLVSAITGSSPIFAGSALADTLRAGINKEDVLRGDGPSLSRGDMTRGGNDMPGSGDSEPKPDDGGMLQAPPGAFDSTSVFQGTPKFNMDANCNGDGNPFAGKPMIPQGDMDQAPGGNMGGNPSNNNNRIMNSAPPQAVSEESDRQMQLLWDAWHKRVAENIYTRFSNSANMLFHRSQPLACQVGYMVSRDGRIGNVRILQPSSNSIYNTMLVGVIKSIAGDPVLQYPPNSRRQFVEKTGTFTWNYTGGQGFKYTTGDHEQISLKGR